MMRLFQVLGELCQFRGNIACNTSADASGVERKWIEPYSPQAVTDGSDRQFVEQNAIRVSVRELGVILAHQGEVGEEFDAEADVNNDQERRPVVGQSFGVTLGLVAGCEHGLIPARSLADGSAAARTDADGCGLIAALLGFENKAAALTEVDPAGTGGAVSVVEVDGSFEDVGVL